MQSPNPDPVAPDAFAYDYTGQVAVITGGGRGFGLLFARALAARGATAVLAELDEKAGEEAAAALRAEGLKAFCFPLDVTSPEQSDAVATRARQEFGRLDIWVNNAGIARHGESVNYPADTWRLCIDIMLSGTFYGAQAAARQMIEAGTGGSIINIASVNGFVAQSGRAAYSTAKAGVIRLTEVLAAEWAPHNIRVNAIAPAVFLTDLARTSLKDGSASMDVYLNRSPMRRLGELPELAPTVLFLASAYSDYITGQTLRVDGGWVADHYL
ncbi:MAG: SDR family oxidoreductase [Chloroflexi bacterium]|nr:SDR family oxidoreductase [Chloroflexota bacterium]